MPFTDTPEKQSTREQFKKDAEAKREAVKNAPPKEKPVKEDK